LNTEWWLLAAVLLGIFIAFKLLKGVIKILVILAVLAVVTNYLLLPLLGYPPLSFYWGRG
jgi:hypothetical protein